MPTKPDTQSVIDSVLLASQLDQLHLSIGILLDMLKEGETDLFLEAPGKSDRQKALYLGKVLEKVASPELRQLLEAELKKDTFSFFLRLNLEDFLRRLQEKAEEICVVKLQVALSFKPADLREMAGLLAGRIGRPVALDVTVERELIGGAIIQHGNYLSDYSIKSRLGQFREDWEEDLGRKKL